MLKSLKATRNVSPLQRAKTHELRATYVIAGITGITLIMLFRSITIAATEPPIAQERLLEFVVTIVQVAVSATSLAILRYQVGLTTIEIEQAEQAEYRLIRFAAIMQSVIDRPPLSPSGEAFTNAADSPKPTSAR
jgi:hypothetical protein